MQRQPVQSASRIDPRVLFGAGNQVSGCLQVCHAASSRWMYRGLLSRASVCWSVLAKDYLYAYDRRSISISLAITRKDLQVYW